MKSQAVANVDKSKVVAVWLLFMTAAVITLSGVALIVYSFVNDVSYRVMQTDVSGSVFGVIIAFLGVRYLLSVRKLRLKLYATHARFSWKNFRAK